MYIDIFFVIITNIFFIYLFFPDFNYSFNTNKK